MDRQLAIESLKRVDNNLYNMYRKVQDVKEFMKKDPASYQKLQIYLLSLDALDDLEKMGVVEIINDYQKKAVYVKRNP